MTPSQSLLQNDYEGDLSFYSHTEKKLINFYCYILNNQLQQYSNKVNTDPCHIFDLRNCQINALDQKVKRKYAFEIIDLSYMVHDSSLPNTINNNGKYICCCETVSDRDYWVSLLLRHTLSSELPEYKFYSGEKEEKSLIIPIVSLKECAPKARHSVLWRRMRIAGIIFDPKNITFKKEIIYKIKIWKDLNETLIDMPTILNDKRCIEDIINTLEHNIFRPLPYFNIEYIYIYDMEEDEYVFKDPNMQTLVYAYEVLLSLINSAGIDSYFKRIYFNEEFCMKIIYLFQSNDESERDYLKKILHSLYAKQIHLRPFLRKQMNYILYSKLEDEKYIPGANEILYIYSFIIDGMSVPIREEHIITFKNILVPLHKYKYIETIYMNLSRCIYLFVQKDTSLAEDIILRLLRCWPYGNRLKEQLYVDELEHILSYLKPNDIEHCYMMLFKRINKLLQNDQYEVIQKQLHWWKVGSICDILVNYPPYANCLFPMIMPHLYYLSKYHWWIDVQKLSAAVLEKYANTNDDFRTTLEQYKNNHI
ncbi:hypothetical protein WA158_005141 [Blastocystis sp. Blastoise]